MKRPWAFICASEDASSRALSQYCRRVYELGYVPVCPRLQDGQYLVLDDPAERSSYNAIVRDKLLRCPILAAADGTVVIANGVDSWGGSYGYYVKLDHGNGLQTLYAHCQAICVTTGQQVQAGQVIGYVGHTGRATGDHLHFEVYENGQRTDAMRQFS